MKLKKSCDTCIYYESYYTIINGIFEKVDCGYCENSLVKPRKSRRCPYVRSCKFFCKTRGTGYYQLTWDYTKQK